MSFVRQSLLFHQDIVNTLTLVDVGASGSLVEPWASLQAAGKLTVIGFEPGELGAHRPYALWKHGGDIELHIAEDISTSSVHQPNWPLLHEFAPKHWRQRKTAHLATVPAMTLDEALGDEAVDFVKIDTQGSEYEILSGGRNVLARTHGCTLETWTSEVHKGQALTGDILSLMAQSSHRLMDMEKTAVWQRPSAYRRSRGELVGIDLLYLNMAPQNVIRAALVADLWGYRTLAAEWLKADGSSEARILLGIMDKLDRSVIIKPQGRLGQLLDMVLPRLLPVRPSVPRVH